MGAVARVAVASAAEALEARLSPALPLALLPSAAGRARDGEPAGTRGRRAEADVAAGVADVARAGGDVTTGQRAVEHVGGVHLVHVVVDEDRLQRPEVDGGGRAPDRTEAAARSAHEGPGPVTLEGVRSFIGQRGLRAEAAAVGAGHVSSCVGGHARVGEVAGRRVGRDVGAEDGGAGVVLGVADLGHRNRRRGAGVAHEATAVALGPEDHVAELVVQEHVVPAVGIEVEALGRAGRRRRRRGPPWSSCR